MSVPPCLLTVHAHPDDEASKGAATVARYRSRGVRTVLVCCTGGEAGDILNPAMDRPEVRERLQEVRLQELAASTALIGYSEVVMLGYRDSGMPGTPENEDPRSFAQAPLDEAVAKLVAVIRRERPQVIITYPANQQGYPHPDHLKVHAITIPAFEAAGNPDAYPEAGPPWQPLKLYYTSWSRKRIVAMHEKYLALGLESPYDEKWFERGHDAEEATAVIDVTGFTRVRDEALLAHTTQIDPTSKFWFGLPPEVAQTVYPYDEYILARSLVPTSVPEDDLFAGIDDLAISDDAATAVAGGGS
ncbi:MAG TPA: mycothiol conjugate amidase Mca [Acidimicrobiales bacterium]|jgi:mycothiol S-conjugate amidase|nr:mycothiol conjugate amidase Mca [Acidimicrobiales bacterium]